MAKPAGPDRPRAVSVCICSHNRADLLHQTLCRLAEAHRPADVRFEVVVVDNCSTDRTAEVLKQAADALPITAVREETLGLSHARNAAVRAATGDLLLWTDDDVLVGSSWIESYVRAAMDYPDVAFFGGPVDPWFEGNPPSWLRPSMPALQYAYAIRDLPPDTTDLGRTSLPFGANFATRSSLHLRLSFNPELGRVGRRDGCLSEESFFLKRALDLGYAGRWVPDSRVAHFIPKDRQTLRYLREFYAIAGATPTSTGDESPLWLGRPRWMWRSLLENEVKFWATRWVAGPETWLPYLKEARVALGALRRRRG